MTSHFPLIKLQATDNELSRSKTPELKPKILNMASSLNPSSFIQSQNTSTSPNNQTEPGVHIEGCKKRRSKSPQLRAMDQMRKTQLKPTIFKAAKNPNHGKNVDNDQKKEEEISYLPIASPPIRRLSVIKEDQFKNTLGNPLQGTSGTAGSALKGLFKKKVNAISLVKRFANVDLEEIPEEELIEVIFKVYKGLLIPC